jgi:hypothetical protein
MNVNMCLGATLMLTSLYAGTCEIKKAYQSKTFVGRLCHSIVGVTCMSACISSASALAEKILASGASSSSLSPDGLCIANISKAVSGLIELSGKNCTILLRNLSFYHISWT